MAQDVVALSVVLLFEAPSAQRKMNLHCCELYFFRVEIIDLDFVVEVSHQVAPVPSLTSCCLRNVSEENARQYFDTKLMMTKFVYGGDPMVIMFCSNKR